MRHDHSRQHRRGENAAVRAFGSRRAWEEVIVNKAGVPFATLVPTSEAMAIARDSRAAKRRAAFGCLAEKYKDHPPEAFDVPLSMTDLNFDARGALIIVD